MLAPVTLFCMVQRKELEDLLHRRSFRTIRHAIEGKLFWTTRADAERFSRLLARIDHEPSWIVEVRVPASTYERLASLIVVRPARFVEEKSLDRFNGQVMDLVLPRGEQPSQSDG